ncbi:MAG: hypothetical protein IPM69_13055 [Ignavibacteria bacterium]|nr:hypothetical protein [Ignavibacteria bacterium]
MQKKILLQLLPSCQNNDKSGYYYTKYLEVVELLGTPNLKETVKKEIENRIDFFRSDRSEFVDIERVLRTLSKIGNSEDEDWLLNLLDQKPYLYSISLCRAIECLGIFGTEKSILFIKKCYSLRVEDNFVQSICIKSYESINMRQGQYREITHEDLLLT